MAENKVQGSRLAYIDNLRALMIIFVVMIHTKCFVSDPERKVNRAFNKYR